MNENQENTSREETLEPLIGGYTAYSFASVASLGRQPNWQCNKFQHFLVDFRVLPFWAGQPEFEELLSFLNMSHNNETSSRSLMRL